MKLSSPRIWFIIATVGLLLAGAVAVIVLNMVVLSLPSGWTVEDHERFEVALPPGNRSEPKNVMRQAYKRIRVEVGPGVNVEVADVSCVDATNSPTVRFPDFIEVDYRMFPIGQCKRIKVQGHPTIIVRIHDRGKTTKHMVVLMKHRNFELRADIVPGVFSEMDANTFFRRFRIKNLP